MPPTRRRPKPKATPRSKPRARRSSPQWRGGLPKLEQRHFDVIGLGLVATAIFFAFVVYLDWDGGQAGDAAVDGLRDVEDRGAHGVTFLPTTAVTRSRTARSHGARAFATRTAAARTRTAAA